MKLLLLFLFCSLFPAFGGGMPSEADVVRSVDQHFPAILQAIANQQASEQDLRASTGAFDTKLLGQNHFVPIGFYRRQHWDFWAEKPIKQANAKVYAGYSYGYPNTLFPPQFSTMSTNIGGTPRIGGSMSLLRDYGIDENRAGLRSAEIGVAKMAAETAYTRIHARKDGRIAYWMWVSALRMLGVYKELLALADNRSVVLQQRVKAGDLSDVVLRENLQYAARRRGDLAASELAAKQAGFNLSLYFRDHNGLPQVVDVVDVSADSLGSAMEERIIGANAGVVAAEAASVMERLRARPDVQSLARELEMNSVAITQAENLAKPRVDVGVDYANNLGDQDPTNADNVLTFFLNVEVPLEYNLVQGRISSNKAKQQSLSTQYRFLLDSSAIEVAKASEGIRLARERATNAKQEFAYAGELLVAENYKFTKGGSTLFLVNMREEAKAQAAETVIFAQLDVLQAHIAYEAATAAQ